MLRFILKNWRVIICWLLSALVVVWGIFSNLEPQFPEPADPKTVIFEWSYNDKDYSVTETLYKTIYDFYKDSSKKEFYEGIRESEYYENFLMNMEAPQDTTISEFVKDIKLEAEKSNLSEDESAEMIIAFIQTIPYDDDKFNRISSIVSNNESPEETWPRFAYEVFYDNQGVCSGKTFLAIAMLEEIGYGTAIFDFSQEEHVAPAVKCPVEYSYNNSGYCYAEVTNTGFKIGMLPDDFDDGKAKPKTTIGQYGTDGSIKNVPSDYKDIKIYRKTDGKSYQKAVETFKTMERINNLEKELSEMLERVDTLKNETEQLKDDLEYYEQQAENLYKNHEALGDYASYNRYKSAYNQYKAIYSKYESKVASSNAEVDKYNALVEEYNAIIEKFYK